MSIFSIEPNNIHYKYIGIFHISLSCSNLQMLFYSHLSVYDLANVCVDPLEETVYALRDLSGEVELTVDLHHLVHVAERNVEHLATLLVAEESLVHP